MDEKFKRDAPVNKRESEEPQRKEEARETKKKPFPSCPDDYCFEDGM